MRHRSRQPIHESGNQVYEVGVSPALVEKYWHFELCGEFKLLFEGLYLVAAWREIPEIIEPAFTYSHDFRRPGRPAELTDCVGIQVAGVMRVQSGS